MSRLSVFAPTIVRRKNNARGQFFGVNVARESITASARALEHDGALDAGAH
jgi:hypothetical protein